MTQRETDFQVLVGKKIASIDVSKQNQIIVTDTENNQFIIEVELDFLHIPTFRLTRYIED